MQNRTQGKNEKGMMGAVWPVWGQGKKTGVKTKTTKKSDLLLLLEVTKNARKPPIGFQISSQMKDEKKYEAIDGGGLNGGIEGGVALVSRTLTLSRKTAGRAGGSLFSVDLPPTLMLQVVVHCS